jgi:hypothetical protein
MLSRILLSFFVLFALSVSTYAQRPQPQDFKGEGTVEGVLGSRIQMKTKANETVVVQIFPQSQVRLTGTTTVDFLRPGLCVEFTAEVAKNLVVKDKISQLTLISPTPDAPLGLYPEGAAPGGKGGDADAGFGDPPSKAGKSSSGRRGKSAGGSGVQLPGVCTVRGTIKSLVGTSLAVTCKGLVKAELDDNVEIAVAVADHTLASKGDAITVHGKKLDKQVLAQSVTIVAQKIEAVGKKGHGKPGTAKATDHSAKAEKVVAKPKPAAKEGAGDADPVEPKEKPKAKEKPKEKPKAKSDDIDDAPLP